MNYRTYEIIMKSKEFLRPRKIALIGFKAMMRFNKLAYFQENMLEYAQDQVTLFHPNALISRTFFLQKIASLSTFLSFL